MPRKKLGVKKPTDDDVNGENIKNGEKEGSENGVEKEKGVVVNDGKIDSRHDTNSVDSKSSGTSSVSIKKRFSFGKRKKNLDHLQSNKTNNQDINVTNQNGDLRRSNSLNNMSQDGSKSKIPILKHKRQHIDTKHGNKHELCPRLLKSGNCESRSLVLNPGMDSWRMAGLMDSVSNANSIQTLNSINSMSEHYKPPIIALSSGLSKDTMKCVEVKNEEPCDPVAENSPTIIVIENVAPTETVGDLNGLNNHHLPELHEDEEIEDMIELNTNNPPQPDIQVSEVDEPVAMETTPNSSPYDTHREYEEGKDISPSVVVLTESVTNEPLNAEEVTEDIFCAGLRPERYTSSNNECGVTPLTSDCNEESLTNETVNGGMERTVVQELYELDDENVISVRKLGDLIIESQIQMPKEVCCDDWLVLDFSHSALVSS